jgi:hypothetical protein
MARKGAQGRATGHHLAWPMKRQLRGAVSVVLSLLVASSASAHDSWISKRRYLDPASREWCCDENDCQKLEQSRVTLVEGGYLVDGNLFVENHRVLPSSDGEFWACFSHDIVSKGRAVKIAIRCFFAPLDV